MRRGRAVVASGGGATDDLVRGPCPDRRRLIELVKHHRPAVIVLDLRMPIMDGWSFAEQYRRQVRPPASLILLTAMKDTEQSGERIGAVACI